MKLAKTSKNDGLPQDFFRRAKRAGKIAVLGLAEKNTVDGAIDCSTGEPRTGLHHIGLRDIFSRAVVRVTTSPAAARKTACWNQGLFRHLLDRMCLQLCNR